LEEERQQREKTVNERENSEGERQKWQETKSGQDVGKNSGEKKKKSGLTFEDAGRELPALCHSEEFGHRPWWSV
jgi:hypothetical protein